MPFRRCPPSPRPARRWIAATLVVFSAVSVATGPVSAATQKKVKTAAKSAATTLAPATTTSPTTTATNSSTTVPIDCTEKLRLLAGLERQKAKVLTKLAGFETRLKQAQAQGRTAVVAALQDQIDENNERLDEIDSQIDELDTRCP